MERSLRCALLLASSFAYFFLLISGTALAKSRRQDLEASLYNALSTLGARDLSTCADVFRRLDRNCSGYMDSVHVNEPLSMHDTLTDIYTEAQHAVSILRNASSCYQHVQASSFLTNDLRPVRHALRLLAGGTSCLKRRLCSASAEEYYRSNCSGNMENVANTLSGMRAFAAVPVNNSVVLKQALLCNGFAGATDLDSVQSQMSERINKTLKRLSRAQNATLSLLPKLEHSFESLRLFLDLVRASPTDRQKESGVLYVLQVRLPTEILRALDRLGNTGVIQTYDIGEAVSLTKFVACTVSFPDVANRKPCPWLCNHSSLLVNLADYVSSASEVDRDSAFDLLSHLAAQCTADSAMRECLVPSCNNTNGVCTVANFSATARTQAQTRQTCFNTKCPHPLHQTSNRANWNKELQETLRQLYLVSSELFPNRTFNDSALPCGVQCDALSFGEDAERTTRIIVGIFAFPLFFTCFFVLVSFYLSRDQYNRYPTNVLLYLYIMMLLATGTLLVRYVADQKTYSCNSDGTMRTGEPKSVSSGGSPFCVFIFIISSFSLVAASCWWLALTHAWFVTLQTLDIHHGRRERARDNYMRMYHAISWTVPAIVTSVMLGEHNVEGFSLFGTCWTMNTNVQFYYYGIPQLVCGVIGIPLLIRGGICFYRHWCGMRKSHAKRLQRTRSQLVFVDMRRFIYKLTVLVVINFFGTLVNFVAGVFMKSMSEQWDDSRRRHVACAILSCADDVSHCPPISRPPLSVFLLIPLAMIVEGLVLCSFIVNGSTVRVWKEVFGNARSRLLTSSMTLPSMTRLSSTLSLSRKSRSSFEQQSTNCPKKRSASTGIAQTLTGPASTPAGGAEQGHNKTSGSVQYILDPPESITDGTALSSSEEASAKSVSIQLQVEIDALAGNHEQSKDLQKPLVDGRESHSTRADLTNSNNTEV